MLEKQREREDKYDAGQGWALPDLASLLPRGGRIETDEFDLDNTYFIQNQTWNGATFTPSAYAFRDKIAYEIHNYQDSAGSCDDIRPGMYKNAYCAMNLTDPACPNHGPTVLTEFGFDQTDGSYTKPYAQCISEIVTEQPGGPGGWMQWALAGSYYIRSGIQDFEEPWGEPIPNETEVHRNSC